MGATNFRTRKFHIATATSRLGSEFAALKVDGPNRCTAHGDHSIVAKNPRDQAAGQARPRRHAAAIHAAPSPDTRDGYSGPVATRIRPRAHRAARPRSRRRNLRSFVNSILAVHYERSHVGEGGLDPESKNSRGSPASSSCKARGSSTALRPFAAFAPLRMTSRRNDSNSPQSARWVRFLPGAVAREI